MIATEASTPSPDLAPSYSVQFDYLRQAENYEANYAETNGAQPADQTVHSSVQSPALINAASPATVGDELPALPRTPARSVSTGIDPDANEQQWLSPFSAMTRWWKGEDRV